jgi:competence protein ComEC
MVEALVLARREHLDPELREAFALSGTAHLLAISGFHVGVVAGILLGALRWMGVRPRRAAVGAAVGCWVYVLGIGAPHAAVRAALLLTLLAAARMRGRPVVPAGALASAFLLLLIIDPANLRSVGFQLSFAGTGGLVLLRRPLADLVDGQLRRWMGRPLLRGRKTRGPGEGLLKGGTDGLVAGTAATLPTLPLLAWHFDRISLVGIPATLAIAPVVAMAIPGIGAAVLLSLPAQALGEFLAGGVGLLLTGVDAGVRWTAELPGASIWVSRPALLVAGGVGIVSLLVLGHTLVGRVAPGIRRLAAVGFATAGLLVLPLVPAPDHLEVHMIDVGQGDAVAIRFPSDRWVVVDAGPRSHTFDAGERRVVPYLRRRGVRRIEALVLSHPHLDHVGGATAVLESFPVTGILDPSRPVPSASWHGVLLEARARGISWWAARAGMQMRLGHAELHLLHPDPATAADPELTDWNDLSVVLLVRWGGGTVLLTGDAYHWIEERIAEEVSHGLSVLKVGHHGSRTSTSDALLRGARPEAALIPVGSGNRYGHPHREVRRRLESYGIETYRTDRDGDVRVRIGRGGSVDVRTAR